MEERQGERLNKKREETQVQKLFQLVFVNKLTLVISRINYEHSIISYKSSELKTLVGRKNSDIGVVLYIR